MHQQVVTYCEIQEEGHVGEAFLDLPGSSGYFILKRLPSRCMLYDSIYIAPTLMGNLTQTYILLGKIKRDLFNGMDVQ